MSTNALLIANTNVLELNGLRNALSDEFINAALVAATLQDISGVDVAGQSWPVTLNYVPGSKGCYQILLSASLNLINKKKYKLTLVAQGSGMDARWESFLNAKVRR